MNYSINIVANTSLSLHINDKEVLKKTKKREYDQRPEVKAKKREYQQKPEVKEKIKEYKRKWYQENKLKIKTYRQSYKIKKCKLTPELKTKKIKHRQRSEVKIKRREYKKRWYQMSKEIKLKDNVIKSKKEIKIINQIDDEQMIDNLLLTNLEVEQISSECLLFDFDEIEEMANSPLTNLAADDVNGECLQISDDINSEQMIDDLLTNLKAEEITSINQLLVTNNYSLTSQGG